MLNYFSNAPLEKLDVRWQNELSRILPDLQNNTLLAPITESWQKRVFFEAMARALLAGNEPVMLLLDDIQWCDKDTLEWLGFWAFKVETGHTHQRRDYQIQVVFDVGFVQILKEAQQVVGRVGFQPKQGHQQAIT